MSALVFSQTVLRAIPRPFMPMSWTETKSGYLPASRCAISRVRSVDALLAITMFCCFPHTTAKTEPYGQLLDDYINIRDVQ